MKENITYNQLMMLDQDIRRQSQSIAFAYLNKEKIKRFYQENQMRLKIMDERMQGFIKKYVSHDDKNKPIIIMGEDGRETYLFASDQLREEYKQKTMEFLSTSMEILL